MDSYKMGLRSFFLLSEALEQIPAIGKKSAQKIAMSLCADDKMLGFKVAHMLEEAVRNVGLCKMCLGLSEDEICSICAAQERQNGELCVVGHRRDIFSIENLGEFGGRYFVLDSRAHLQDFDFSILLERVKNECVREIIFALSPSIANDAIMLFVEDKLRGFDLKFTKIAQGVPTGINLDSVDALSLARAISSRVKV